MMFLSFVGFVFNTDSNKSLDNISSADQVNTVPWRSNSAAAALRSDDSRDLRRNAHASAAIFDRPSGEVEGQAAIRQIISKSTQSIGREARRILD